MSHISRCQACSLPQQRYVLASTTLLCRSAHRNQLHNRQLRSESRILYNSTNLVEEEVLDYSYLARSIWDLGWQLGNHSCASTSYWRPACSHFGPKMSEIHRPASTSEWGEGEAEILAFLEQCRESGDSAYAAFKDILARLQSEETRREARTFLGSLEEYVEVQLQGADCLLTYHFRIHQLTLTDYEGFQANRQKLTLLELPSIFIPEDWSFTFFEGINRHPDSGFRNRDVAELGCGNGWVSIALAERWSPRKVYGLDINPRAIKVAWINLYLNALSPDGSPVLDNEGRTLLDRVEFHVSDLLAYCREQNIVLDRIIGCIPQILNPDPEAMMKIVSENASEDFLYSLSNYCGLQGFVEDQFGLGLVARAVEEGIASIKPTGAMIFNVGGRPGQAVCQRLFERRGFQITKLWQTRVNQAADTDILALVEIEKNSRHRFEFFMGRSDEPISARTAWAYAQAGGVISHGLSVYECHLRQPNQVKTIFKFLSDGLADTRGAVDLSLEDTVADEKIPFLAHLARALGMLASFPYELPSGSIRFRNLVAGFLRIYHRIPLSSNNLIIVPSRSVAIENILRLYSPRLAVVDASLTRLLPKKWLTCFPCEGRLSGDDVTPVNPCSSISVVEAPHRADLVIQLVRHLKPQVVITSLADFEMRTATAFEKLLETTANIGARVFLDISEHVELSSLPGTNGVLQYLAVNPLPLHATIICGLVKNQVYADLEVAFVISENKSFLNAFARAGELTYGRTAVSSQFYYGCLLHELLSFQLPDRHVTAERLPKEEARDTQFIDIPDLALSTLSEAELLTDGSNTRNVIHMDLDENALPTASAVKVSLFEAFARQNVTDIEMDPRPEILEYLTAKFGYPTWHAKDMVFSDSVTALFGKLVLACVEESGTLCFPVGANGAQVSAAKFLRASVKQIPTEASEGFKLSVRVLDGFLQSVNTPWLCLSAPTTSPTGVTYSGDEINALLAVCRKHGSRVILVTAYSGLEFEDAAPWDLETILTDEHPEQTSTFAVALLGSSSTVAGTGGLEFGFAALQDAVFLDIFKDAPSMSKPHGTVRYCMKKLFAMLNQGNNFFTEEFAQQQALLKQRVAKLEQVLASNGWEPINAAGGVSVAARPVSYEGKKVSYDGADGSTQVVLDGHNIREALFRTTGLYISDSSWTGLPSYCRFVAALDEDHFNKALKAIEKFKELVLGVE